MSKLTVVDAVNKREGVWRKGKNYLYIGSKHNSTNEGLFDFTTHDVNSVNWDFICTVTEFNQCVEEMTNLVPKSLRGVVNPIMHQHSTTRG